VIGFYSEEDQTADEKRPEVEEVLLRSDARAIPEGRVESEAEQGF